MQNTIKCKWFIYWNSYGLSVLLYNHICLAVKPNFHIVSVLAESTLLSSSVCRSVQQHINQTNSHISSVKAGDV